MKKCFCLFLLGCSCFDLCGAGSFDNKKQKTEMTKGDNTYKTINKRCNIYLSSLNESVEYKCIKRNNDETVELEIKEEYYAMNNRKLTCCSSCLFRIYCWITGLHYKV